MCPPLPGFGWVKSPTLQTDHRAGATHRLALPYAIAYARPMKHTTSTDLRKNLSAYMDRVNDDHEPLLVTRANGKPVLMISVEDYDSLDETSYLLSSPANAQALRAAMAQVESGDVVARTVEELDALGRE